MTDIAVGAVGQQSRQRLMKLLAYTAALLIAIAMIVPVVFVALGGFRSNSQLINDPAALPDPWLLDNYRRVVTNPDFWWQVWTSTLIGAITTALVVGLGAMAAYPLSRFAFRGREALYTLFTIGLLFPITVAILPLYLMVRGFGLLDQPLGVALPQAAFGLPLTIVILRPFMRAIPGELEEAAMIDGCSRFTFFLRILLPLSKPALVTVAVVTFIQSWNAYLLPLLVLGDPLNWTLPLGVANFNTQYSQDTAAVLAFTALSMLPALMFFVLAERRIVGGLSGAVKG